MGTRTEIDGSDLVVICAGLKSARKKHPQGSLEYKMLSETLRKLQDLNTLCDYVLFEKS